MNSDTVTVCAYLEKLSRSRSPATPEAALKGIRGHRGLGTGTE